MYKKLKKCMFCVLPAICIYDLSLCVAVYQFRYRTESYVAVQLLLGRRCCGINMHKWQYIGTSYSNHLDRIFIQCEQ